MVGGASKYVTSHLLLFDIGVTLGGFGPRTGRRRVLCLLSDDVDYDRVRLSLATMTGVTGANCKNKIMS